MKIEKLLSEIKADYYKTAEYKNWLANLNEECRRNKVCWQEYCWQSLHDYTPKERKPDQKSKVRETLEKEAFIDEYANMFFARSRGDAICYLLQDPEGNVLCDRYERYINVLLYKAVKERDPHKQADLLKGLPKDDTLLILHCYYRAENLICLQAIINKFCYNPAVDNHSRNKAKGIRDYVRGNNATEKEAELLRIKSEIEQFGFTKRGASRDAYAQYLVKQVIRADGRGLIKIPSTPALMELWGKGKNTTDGVRNKANELLQQQNHTVS